MQVTIDTRHDTLEEALASSSCFFPAVEPAPAGSARPRRTGTKKTAAKKSRPSKPAKGTVTPRGEQGASWQEGSHIPRRPQT